VLISVLSIGCSLRLCIDQSRIQAQGFGELLPVASNSDAIGRQRNHRVDLIFNQQQEIYLSTVFESLAIPIYVKLVFFCRFQPTTSIQIRLRKSIKIVPVKIILASADRDSRTCGHLGYQVPKFRCPIINRVPKHRFFKTKRHRGQLIYSYFYV